MTLAASGDLRLFVLAALLLSLAIVPIGLTRISSPHPIPAVRVTPRTLLRASRVAVVCAVLAGMVTSAFWTLGPVVGGGFGLSPGQVGFMMSIGVLGGALFQYPVGRVSDWTDRRLVMGGLALAAVGAGVLGALFAAAGSLALYGAMALLCAAVMPMYALCIALAGDNTELTLVEVTGGVLLAHSMGSILGPIVVAAPMAAIGPSMFFIVCAACMTVAAVWTFYRYFLVERPRTHEIHAPLLPRTTQAVAELLADDGAAPQSSERT